MARLQVVWTGRGLHRMGPSVVRSLSCWLVLQSWQMWNGNPNVFLLVEAVPRNLCPNPASETRLSTSDIRRCRFNPCFGDVSGDWARGAWSIGKLTCLPCRRPRFYPRSRQKMILLGYEGVEMEPGMMKKRCLALPECRKKYTSQGRTYTL